MRRKSGNTYLKPSRFFLTFRARYFWPGWGGCGRDTALKSKAYSNIKVRRREPRPVQTVLYDFTTESMRWDISNWAIEDEGQIVQQEFLKDGTSTQRKRCQDQAQATKPIRTRSYAGNPTRSRRETRIIKHPRRRGSNRTRRKRRPIGWQIRRIDIMEYQHNNATFYPRCFSFQSVCRGD